MADTEHMSEDELRAENERLRDENILLHMRCDALRGQLSKPKWRTFLEREYYWTIGAYMRWQSYCRFVAGCWQDIKRLVK